MPSSSSGSRPRLALVVHFANRFLAPEADPVIMPIVLMLNGIGFVMIYRLDASPQVSRLAPWHYQAVWTVLGVIAYVTTLAVVRRSRDLERYRYMLMFAALVLLVLPLAPVIGRTPEAAAERRQAVDPPRPDHLPAG